MSSPDPAPSPRLLGLTLLGLLALLGLALAVLWLPAGPWRPVASLTVAAAKATLIVLVFMRARWATDSTRLFILGGLFWLAILFGLTFADYLTR